MAVSWIGDGVASHDVEVDAVDIERWPVLALERVASLP